MPNRRLLGPRFLSALLASLMMAIPAPSRAATAMYLAGYFAPATPRGWSYAAGGGKLSLDLGTRLRPALRYLAESEKPCPRDCTEPGRPEVRWHEVETVAFLLGPTWNRGPWEYGISTGLGGYWGQKIHYADIGESREWGHGFSLPADAEAWYLPRSWFGLGLTAYGAWNPGYSIYGALASLRFGIPVRL